MAKTRRINLPITRDRWPRYMVQNGVPTIQGSAANISAAGDRYTIVGHVEWADGGSHDLRTIHFRTGGATAATLTLRVGPRDVDLANGPPARDDGTPDQVATQANPSANTTYSLTLDADRTLAHGALIALTWDCSAYTSGNVNIAGIGQQTGNPGHRPVIAMFDDPTWAVAAQLGMVTIEAADGTFGIIADCMPRVSAVNTHTFNSGSAADEIGIEFTVPGPVWVDGASFFVTTVAGGDFDVVLYEGTTALATVTVDANTWNADAATRWCHVRFAEQALTAGNTYRLVVKPGGTNVTIYSLDVTAAGHLAAFAGSSKYVDRVDAGSWNSPTATRLPFCFIDISAIDDGAGAGGGGVVRPFGLHAIEAGV